MLVAVRVNADRDERLWVWQGVHCTVLRYSHEGGRHGQVGSADTTATGLAVTLL